MRKLLHLCGCWPAQPWRQFNHNERSAIYRSQHRGDGGRRKEVPAHGTRSLLRHSEPLTPDARQTIESFFSADLLARLRTITLTGAPVPPPPFYLTAKEISG